MKISIQSYNNTFTWESEGEDDLSIQAVAEHLKGLLVAVGYHPNSVDEVFSSDAAEWFPEENRRSREEPCYE